MPYGYAAAAVGSVASSLIGSSASDKAAKQQAQAQQEALQLQEQNRQQTVGAIQPYQAYGTNALQNLQQLLGIGPGGAGPVASNPILQMLGIGGPGPTGQINPATFEGSPGYQYAKQQGLDAVTNAATRGPGGGNALLALQKTGTQLANQNWGDYLSNASTAWQQLLQNIGGGVSTGLNSTSLLAGSGQNFANAAGGNLAGIGNALSAGTVGGANATIGNINNLAGLAGGAAMSNPGWFGQLFGSSNNSGTGPTTTVYNPNVTGGSYQTSNDPNGNF